MSYKYAIASVLHRDSFREMSKVDLVFFSHDVDLSESKDGRPFGRLLDSIAEIGKSRGMSFAHVAHPYSILTGKRSWAGHYRMNRASAIAAVLRKLRFKRFAYSYSENKYRKILLLAQPRIVFTIGLPEALCRAARSLGIEIVEVLHGKGYQTIPWGWENRLDSELPSAVLALDPVSFETFNLLKPRGVRVLFVEDFWLKRFSVREGELLPTEWKFPETLHIDNDHVVLVSMQWGYNHDNLAEPELDNILENGFLPQAIMNAISASHHDVQWLLRLHPVQLRSNRLSAVQRFVRLIELNNPNVEWQDSTRMPLPSVLSRATRHATMNSGSTVEAAQMGVPTALFCPTLEQGKINEGWYSDLRTSGFARLFDLEDAESLLRWVREPLPLLNFPEPENFISIDTAIQILLSDDCIRR